MMSTLRISKTWPDNKPVDITFVGQAVMLPVICSLALINLLMILVSADRHYMECRWKIAKSREYDLKTYANQYLTLAGWTALTPLEEPALSMLKLEGEFPLAPKTLRKIPRDDQFEFTPNEQLFNRLLTPLAEKLKTPPYNAFKSALWVRGGDASCCDDLQRAFARLGIAPGKIEYLPQCPGYALINDWIDKARGYVFNRLLVIVDIYDDEEGSKSMENATALLLTNHYMKTVGEKPVYLYRPISGLTDVENGMPVYLQVRPVNAPKTLWYTGLSKVEKYSLMQALDEAKLAANRLALETSFGEKSAGYRWQALVLAAEAVKYAQGDQLIVASDNNRLDVTTLSSRLMEIPPGIAEADYVRPWRYGTLAGLLIALAALLGCGIFNDAGADERFPAGIVLFMMMGSVVIFSGIGIFITFYIQNKASEHMWG